MTDYYYSDGKDRFGPFTLQELRQQNLTPDTYVWWHPLTDWKKARNVPELSDLFANHPPPSPKNPGTRPKHGKSSGRPPKNWLVEAILVTIFCCQPFGIVGIVYAAQVESKFRAGDIQEAEHNSRKARFWVRLGFWSGITIVVLYLAFYAVMFLGFFKEFSNNFQNG